jgi:hypothetical protein
MADAKDSKANAALPKEVDLKQVKLPLVRSCSLSLPLVRC